MTFLHHYQPAFFEVFLAWAAVVAWAWWLGQRPGTPAFVWPAVRVVTVAVVAALGSGVVAALGQLAYPGSGLAALAPVASWGGAMAVGLGLMACLVGTLLRSRSPQPDLPDATGGQGADRGPRAAAGEE